MSTVLLPIAELVSLYAKRGLSQSPILAPIDNQAGYMHNKAASMISLGLRVAPDAETRARFVNQGYFLQVIDGYERRLF